MRGPSKLLRPTWAYFSKVGMLTAGKRDEFKGFDSVMIQE
jgi:hypothetical protein